MSKLIPKPLNVLKMKEAAKPSGWQPGPILYHNPGLGVQIIPTMMVDDESGAPAYDALLFAERGGGLFVPVSPDNKKIGLQKMWRPATRDQVAYAKSYPVIDFSMLGRESWEAPGGFGDAGESGKEAALREATEETGGAVKFKGFLGYGTSNRAFNPHLTAYSWGEITLDKPPLDKKEEGILKGLTWFTFKEIDQMIQDGQIICDMTINAIGRYLLRCGTFE